MGSGATVHLQQEYGAMASTSHTDTEPLALVTNSDLFSEASKSSEIIGFKKKKFENEAQISLKTMLLTLYPFKIYIKHTFSL